MALTKTVLAALVAAIVVGAVSFYIGFTLNPTIIEMTEIEGLPESYLQVYGTVKSVDGGTMTVSLVNGGGERQVAISEDTPVTASVIDRDLSALKPGEVVLLGGATNDAGVIDADYISIMTDVAQ